MKNTIAIFLFILALTSCDKIKHPDQRPPVVYHCVDTATQIITTNSSTNVNARKVLVEDYTGHRCPNCPPAAVAAEGLVATFGSKVVIIANHVTNNFAKPISDTTFKEDFRNNTSNAWDDKIFKISISGLPKGMVNRQQPFPKAPSSWSGLVSQNLALAQTAKMEMTSYYNPTNAYVSISIKTTFKAAWPNDVNIMILLTQDSIISDQDDGAPPAGSTIDPKDPLRRLNYRFDNIVMGSVNDPSGGSGQLVKKGPVVVGDTITLVNNCFLTSKCFYPNTLVKISPKATSVCTNDRKVKIVAFLYDVVTQEVLQAEQMKIRP